ncbi:FG-GAP-like repeat-containing protein [Luteitalea sp. TBR-22]|uniref:FG-GAP-like repeat-containing protein n=1 Tax=Luteitalea sp. TBR-22 TaxID=2802971 RepID=UPI001EF46AAA|nr:FG-GAP-like repeat-containing protein [Luteitalea sp. TBR-22]
MTVVDIPPRSRRGPGGLRAVLLGALCAALCAQADARGPVVAPLQSPAGQAPDTRHARLLGEADAIVAGLDAPTSGVSALDRLASALGSLGSDLRGTTLHADVVADLDRAVAALRAIVAAPGPDLPAQRRATGVDEASLRALLARVRRAVDGTVALGLAFQGSYSQSKVKEQAYGGHASAMGPAPAPAAPSADGPASPVTFVERGPLPTRTFDGGPTKDHVLESPGNGLALVDVDNDGWLDIYLVTGAQLTATRERVAHRNALYRNRGDWTFEDVSARAGVDAASWGNGVCAGDVDGDARIDMYVTNWGPNLLYRNRGDGTFEEIGARAGVAVDGWSTGCAFLDADADGDLDLYVARYVRTSWEEVLRARKTLRWRNGPAIMVGPAGLPGEADLFFENLGEGRFREATAAFGLVDDTKAYGFGVVPTDVDDDGDVDLFVANDSNPNFLYRNTGRGTFESAGMLAGVGVNAEARAQAGMGVDAGDADGDGRMDLVLTAFAHDRNTLYRNLGDGLFEDASLAAGLATSTFTRMGWGVAFLDADLDGRQDLFVANGHIFPDVAAFPDLDEQYAQKNQLLLNRGGIAFSDVSASAGPGLQVARVSRGMAVGDLDNDGDPDVVVSNMDDTPTLLENRQATGHHWVALRLDAPTGNRLAIGATVTVTAGPRSYVREVRSGGSFMSQGDLRVLVGLGTHSAPVQVDVRMPGGARWRWSGLPVDRLHRLTLTPEARLAPGAAR